MKLFLLTVLLILCIPGIGQTHTDLKKLEPSESYENIHIQKISDDSLQTTFVIWVKKSVKAHYHAVHSEGIYIIEGKGIMKINGDVHHIKSGEYLNFPLGMIHSVLEVTSKKPLKVISFQAPQFIGKDRIFVESE